MTASCSTDIVILGGGIAGLWLLNRLRDSGYSAVLLEANELGGEQSLASQGIIHGGLKYALGGSVTDAANTIAELPARWRACFAGNGEIDLSDCPVLSERYYMWSGNSVRSKIKAFFGSKSLQGRVEPVAKQDYPEFFADATIGGSLYALPDFAVDTPSLLRTLHSRHANAVFKIDASSLIFERSGTNNKENTAVTTLRCFDPAGAPLEISAQRFVFSAGKGNAELITRAGLKRPRAQLRPLKMLWLKSAKLGNLFAHCIGDDFSLTPKLTVTTHPSSDGRTLWYLGGEIAENGVGVADAELISRGQRLLQSLFPWVELADAEWGCLPIDRAEAAMADGKRPDGALFVSEANCLVAWPTKLTLAPALADGVLADLEQHRVLASADDGPALQTLTQHMPPATLAQAHWDRE